MWRRALFVSLLALASAPAGHAHRSLSDAIQVVLDGDELTLETSLGADDLQSFDSDGDGRISKAEHDAQAPGLRAWLAAFVVIRDSSGETLAPVYEDAPIPHYADMSAQDAIEGIRLIRHYKLEAPVCIALGDSAQDRRFLLIVNGSELEKASLTPGGACRPIG